MPTALCKPYESTTQADRAVADLLAAGVPGPHVRVLMGAEIHDARREDRGRFAGSVAPEERVGAYAGDGPERSALRGSFAGAEGVEGTFANAERDIVVTEHDGREQVRVANRGELKRLLMEAGLDDATAEADVRALHDDGRVVVLVDIAAIDKAQARALLDGAAKQASLG
jgi:hypothetical protein